MQPEHPPCRAHRKTAQKIDEALRRAGFESILHCGYDLKKAVDASRKLAEPGGAVLLSPACASFDMFHDYEDRGRVFKQLVLELE